jgi:NAD(P)-dependent dehydrogenase (short-subunit alcohol dehydrogenase family)
MKFAGKTVVITGAASGIGHATALKFAAEGATVIASDIDEAGGERLVAETDGDVRFKRCDITSDADLKALMDFAAESTGGIDVLFNNAGSPGSPDKLEQISAETWDRIMALVLRAPTMGIHHAIAHMKGRKGASIINVASTAGMASGLGLPAYSVAKAGVLHLTKIAAAELAPYGIRVNAISPGLIVTNLMSHVLRANPEQYEKLRPKILDVAATVQPVARAGVPEDIANAVFFLASDDAGFITGTNMVVDGGITVGERRSWDPTVVGPLEHLKGMIE